MLMRTTVELDEKLLQEAMSVTGTKKKRQLLEAALQELVRQRRLERLRQRLGKTALLHADHHFDLIAGKTDLRVESWVKTVAAQPRRKRER